jgi:putative transposase
VVTRTELRPLEAVSPESSADRRPETENVTEAQLDRLRVREEALRPYLGSKNMSGLDAQRLAKRLGVSARTVRRWLRRYQRYGDATELLPRRRGVRRGQRYLDPVVEAIIRDTAVRKLRESGNCSVRSVYELIRGDCEAVGKATPAKATVLDRIKRLKADPEVLPPDVARPLREQTRLVRGSADSARALGRVEIDHTLVDTHIVDAKDRGPLGRPWLTVAIDVFTRVILGFILTLESPSRLSVALCLRHAMFPKDSWLKRIGAAGPWPVFGRPNLIYTDNGPEFRSPSFRMGCKRQHIENDWRPVRTPRYGGTVERLIGTFMKRMRLIPGNTFNEILGKRSPYPAQQAVLTLEDLERWFTNEITAYHHERHSSLRMSPLAAWEAAWRTPRGVVIPPHPNDPRTAFTDLLPHAARVVKPVGIELHTLHYRSEALVPYVKAGVKRIVRIDPRDISSVSLELPTGGHVQVPWTNQGWPRMSLWEWNEIRRRNGRRGNVASPEVVRECLAANAELIARRIAEGQLRARRRRARAERWQPGEPASEAGACLVQEVPADGGRGRRRRRQRVAKPALTLPPLPKAQLEVSRTSIDSPVPFEVLE